MIGQSLTEMSCKVKYARGDADVLISLTAVELAKESPVTVVGDDTDLLVFLLHRTHEITLRPQQRSSKVNLCFHSRYEETTPNKCYREYSVYACSVGM